MKYVWFMAFALFFLILVYCPLAHWIFFHDGWLFQMGIIDFAGGLVIHVASGVSGLTLAFWASRDRQKIAPQEPHAMPYVLLGAALLWFGWFGFNAGSAVSASSNLSAHVFVNTQICAATGMLMYGVMEIIFGGAKYFSGKPTPAGAAIGIVVGLVVITPACGAITPMWAIFFGVVGSFTCYFGLRVPKMIGIDPYETLDGFGIHGIGGALGTLLVGLFASTQSESNVSGAFYGNPMQLAVQLVGILVATGMSAVGTTAIFWFLQLGAWSLGDDVRISALVGCDELDWTEHSSSA
jgi:Amt family ammonium transporter